MQVNIQTGSATSARPTAETETMPARGVIVAHLCNSVGAWRSGFVLAVNDLSLAAKHAYVAFCKDHKNQVPLGTTQFVEVQPNVWVANMIAQDGIDKAAVPNGRLVDYKALDTCLKEVLKRAILLGCNVHIPAGMGSGLAGGDKGMITTMIKSASISLEVELLEKQMQVNTSVTLWEFDDTSAASYVGEVETAESPKLMTISQAADDCDRGIDLSDL